MTFLHTGFTGCYAGHSNSIINVDKVIGVERKPVRQIKDYRMKTAVCGLWCAAKCLPIPAVVNRFGSKFSYRPSGLLKTWKTWKGGIWLSEGKIKRWRLLAGAQNPEGLPE